MARQGIVPIELELTEGTAYTLWAPSWREGNAEWQALLGNDSTVYLFRSAAELLAFLESGEKHILTSHPSWGRFNAGLPASVIAEPRDRYDLVGLPAELAQKPSYASVTGVDRIFGFTRSIGAIAEVKAANRMFASNSVLSVTENGADHFHGAGAAQWSAIGRVIVANWDNVIDEIDELWKDSPEVDADAVEAAEKKLADAEAEVKARREAEVKAREEEKAAEAAAAKDADPYDSTTWAAAGIDPVRIAIGGRTLYTLRCYLDGRPVFLGRHGEIHTFTQPRTMVRWLLEHDEHDLATMSTWDDVLTAANAGELETEVHPDNEYSFTGITEDIKAGPANVDSAQLGRAYELLADAADWAGDDAVNEVLAGNQQLQWLLNYLLDTGEQSEPVPPYDDEARGWADLESGLVARFTSKL